MPTDGSSAGFLNGFSFFRGRPIVAESRLYQKSHLVTAWVVTFRYVLYVVGLVVGALLAWILLLAAPMEGRFWSCMHRYIKQQVRHGSWLSTTFSSSLTRTVKATDLRICLR